MAQFDAKLPDGSLAKLYTIRGGGLEARIMDYGATLVSLFVPDGENRTVAEMTEEEKNQISHRANALKLLLEKQIVIVFANYQLLDITIRKQYLDFHLNSHQ